MGWSQLPKTWWFQGKWQARFILLLICATPIVGIVAGVTLVKESLVDLPRQYDALKSRGRPLTAKFDECPMQCYLDYPDGQEHVRYDQNRGQFHGLKRGDPVSMRYDPQDPSTRFTVVDIDNRHNSGFGWHLLFGLAFVVVSSGIILYVLFNFWGTLSGSDFRWR